MRSAVPHQLQRGAQTPTPSFDNIVQAQQLLQYHQMQHMPTKFLPAYYGPTAITNPAYGPNSIHIPNDRFVRPPATSRLAPLFAQSGAWQANNVNTATPKSELQNHFNTPVPRARDTRRLTYVEGSDDMYPQSSLGKGGSVRFQILSRSSPPNYNLVTDDENIPFAESARAARPAEWGVMKLGNVSENRSRPLLSCLDHFAWDIRTQSIVGQGCASGELDPLSWTVAQQSRLPLRLYDCAVLQADKRLTKTLPSNCHEVRQEADG